MSAIALVLLEINFHLGIESLLKEKFDITYFAKMENPIFDFNALKYFIRQGISSVSSTAVLFIFAILFFGLLNEAGVFNTMINYSLKFSKNNVYSICILTVVISVVVHLDSSGASSFLIVIPAILPIYEKLGMRKTTLMTITNPLCKFIKCVWLRTKNMRDYKIIATCGIFAKKHNISLQLRIFTLLFDTKIHSLNLSFSVLSICVLLY